MKFNTAYAPGSSLPEPEGLKVIPEYTLNESTGNLEKIGDIPFYDRIQSHYESTRLDYKLRQYQLGNTLALGVPSGTFGDFSGQPTNLAQVLNSKQNAQQQFEQLPAGIKQLFNGSYADFVASLEDGSYEAKLGEYAKSVIDASRAAGAGASSEGGASSAGSSGSQ